MLRISVFALLVAIPLSVADDNSPAPSGGAKLVKLVNKRPHEAVLLIDQQKAIIDKLNTRVSIDQSFDGVPVKDVLAFLGDRYELTFLINNVGFRDMGVEKPEEQVLRIPKMPGVSLRTLLEYSLKQFNATYLIVGNHVEVVDTNTAIKSVYGGLEFSTETELRLGVIQPRVNVIFDNMRLDAALSELADQSGRNVVLDPRMNDAGKTPVTIRLLNTPIDTAVQLVARLHNYDVAAVDNSFVVTTSDRTSGLKMREGGK